MSVADDINREIMECIRKSAQHLEAPNRRIQSSIDRLPDDVAMAPALFAADAKRFIAGVQLRGKRYLDMSGDVGEHARAAMAAKAAGVECVVPDEALGRLIELINFYYKQDGIAVRCADSSGGVVLASSVHVATLSVPRADDPKIGPLSGFVTDVLLLEIASMSSRWLSQCVECAGPLLIKFLVTNVSRSDEVAVRIAFARTEAILSEAMGTFSRTVQSGDATFVTIDLAASARVKSLCGQRQASRNAFLRMRDVMVGEHRKDDRRLAFHLSELLEGLSGDGRRLPQGDFGSDTYWFTYFTGVIEFIKSGFVSRSNTYARYLLDLASSNRYDPGMRDILENWDLARERLVRRFEDVVNILQTGVTVHPIMVINPLATRTLEAQVLAPANPSPAEYVSAPDGTMYWTPMIDGHHRAVSLFLSGALTTEAIFVWSNIQDVILRPAGATSSAEVIGWGDERLARAVEATAESLTAAERLHRTAA